MAGMQACARCGAPVAADAAWCGQCGFKPGARAQFAPAKPALSNPRWPPQPPKAQPAWPPKVARATPGWPTQPPKAQPAWPPRAADANPGWPAQSADQSSAEPPLIVWWRGLSRNAKIGLSAAVIIALVVVGAVGAASGTPSAASTPGASSPAKIAAVSASGTAGSSASVVSAATPTIAASTAASTTTPDSDDQGAPSAGPSFNPNATGALPPGGGGKAADRLPGEPDPNLTPGALNPAVTQQTIGSTICVSGWTATIRPSESFTDSLKVKQITQYGYSNTSTSAYEEDHLISLELGGAPADARNLWPESYTIALSDGRPTGAHTKDAFETKLKDEVCAGSVTLAQAQADIGDHWVHAYYGIALPTSAPTAATTAVPPTQTVPPATAPPSSLTVTITSLPASVAHGAYATMTAHTSAGASCTPTVIYASGTVSSSTSLVTEPADSSGNVSWTWKVGSSTKPGTSTAQVSCTLAGDMATDSRDFQVT
jgi:hypothetical protein